ncbi:hypothetical protein CEXT_235531 [Caerostris extrusa]|uniref:Uncharacterized protein n=1 Tax=Caerostris extrusa TaxID=172846 RepID=A0AAV4UJY0_CAEEX|nr:hypothetical protein CEXT_235531 [Caerostris extrusa]
MQRNCNQNIRYGCCTDHLTENCTLYADFPKICSNCSGNHKAYCFLEISWHGDREPYLIRHQDVLELFTHSFRAVADSSTSILQMAELVLKHPVRFYGPCRWYKIPGLGNEELMQLLRGKKSEIKDVLIRSSHRRERRG